MATLTIQFSPKRHGAPPVFRLGLASDEDATPREHEQHHRALISALLPGICLDGDRNFDIERDTSNAQSMLSTDTNDGYEVIDIG
jgi:hypothetical protein